MLGSITPLGERARNANWLITMTLYTVSSAAAGYALGSALAFLGHEAIRLPVPSSARIGIVGFSLLVGLVADMGVYGVKLPTVRRQVNDAWLYTFRRWVYAVGFGAQLGLGVVTIVTTSTIYVALFAEFLSMSVSTGAAIGLVFGLTRSLMTLQAAGSRTPEQLIALQARMTALDPVSRRLSLTVQALLGSCAVVVSIVR